MVFMIRLRIILIKVDPEGSVFPRHHILFLQPNNSRLTAVWPWWIIINQNDLTNSSCCHTGHLEFYSGFLNKRICVVLFIQNRWWFRRRSYFENILNIFFWFLSYQWILTKMSPISYILNSYYCQLHFTIFGLNVACLVI